MRSLQTVAVGVALAAAASYAGAFELTDVRASFDAATNSFNVMLPSFPPGFLSYGHDVVVAFNRGSGIPVRNSLMTMDAAVEINAVIGLHGTASYFDVSYITFDATGHYTATPLPQYRMISDIFSPLNINLTVSMLPSTGFSPANYTYNAFYETTTFYPFDPSVDGMAASPSGNVPVGSALIPGVPEPGTVALMLAGLGLIGVVRRQKHG